MRLITLLSVVFVLLVLPCALPAVAEEEAPSEPAGASDAEREAVKKFVEELREEVARLRGLEWKHDVPADLLTREQLREKMIEAMEKELTPEEKERDIRILRRFGLIGPDEDPYEMAKEMMEKMVAGFYDPEEKRLYLIEGMAGDAQRPVVVHELTHALEDQYLDLKGRLEPIKEISDRVFAEKCLGEGAAEHTSGLYQKEHPDVAAAYRRGQQDPEMMKRQLEVMRKIPAFMIIPTLLHYSVGPAFVKRAIREAGYPGDLAGVMEKLYADPPVSQEQVLHPKKWFGERKDYPQEAVWSADFAEVAGEGWEKVHDWSSGELDLALYLDFFLGYTKGKINLLLMQMGKQMVPRAAEAAEGWDGGQAYLMEKEGLPAVMIEAMVFDTVEDATEAYEATFDALKKANGGEVEVVKAGEEGSPEREDRWIGEHGPARMKQRGTEIVLVDGVPEDRMDDVWKAALGTTWKKDPRDTWDATQVENPFEGCDLFDASAGWGVKLPGEGWTVEKAAGRPGLVARATKGEAHVELIVIPAPLDTAKPMLENQIRMVGADTESPKETPVAGSDGYRYIGQAVVFYLGGAGGRTVVVVARGSELAPLLEQIDTYAANVVIAEE